MTPIKAKTLIPKAAELSGFSLEEAESTILFYYKLMREKLSSLEEITLGLENFGRFYIKERVKDKTIVKYNNILNHMQSKPDGPRKEQIIRGSLEQLEKLKIIDEKLELRKQKRLAKRKIKEDYVANKIKGSLEKQMEDNQSSD